MLATGTLEDWLDQRLVLQVAAREATLEPVPLRVERIRLRLRTKPSTIRNTGSSARR